MLFYIIYLTYRGLILTLSSLLLYLKLELYLPCPGPTLALNTLGRGGAF